MFLLALNYTRMTWFDALQLRDNIFDVSANLGVDALNDMGNALIETCRRIQCKLLRIAQLHDDIALFAHHSSYPADCCYALMSGTSSPNLLATWARMAATNGEALSKDGPSELVNASHLS